MKTSQAEIISPSYLVNYLSWNGIFAGVIVALMLGSLLNLLGLGLGFISFIPEEDRLATLGAGSIIWLSLNSIVSMGIGGWIASRCAKNVVTRFDGMLQGVVTASLAVLITFFLMATAAGMMLNSAATLIGRSVSQENIQQVAETAKSTMSSMSPSSYGMTQEETQQTDSQSHQRTEETIEKAQQASMALGAVCLAEFFVIAFGVIASAIGGMMGSRSYP